MKKTANKKALVFISAGVGDAILLVPLVNELKKKGFLVTGLFTSKYNCEDIFKNTGVFNSMMVLKNKLHLLLFTALHLKEFDCVFLNHFSYSRSHLKLAKVLGRNIYSNYLGMTNHKYSPSIKFIEPRKDTHDALQNLYLFDSGKTLKDLDFSLYYRSPARIPFNLPENYLCVQISSANSKAPYKNWPLEYWIDTFRFVNETFPNVSMVILGDETEKKVSDQLLQSNLRNVITLVGETNLSQATEIIYRSKFYLGLDSGLMHIAMALDKPTFTLWGASNPTLYGYGWKGSQHHISSLNLWCAPCSAWINPNQKRVSNPLMCPDFQCINQLMPKHVTSELNTFMNNYLNPSSSGNAGFDPTI